MPSGYCNELLNSIKKVPGVSNALWISNMVGIQIPTDMIPASFRDIFFSGSATMMIIQYDYPGASDETMEAIDQVRALCNDSAQLRILAWYRRTAHIFIETIRSFYL